MFQPPHPRVQPLANDAVERKHGVGEAHVDERRKRHRRKGGIVQEEHACHVLGDRHARAVVAEPNTRARRASAAISNAARASQGGEGERDERDASWHLALLQVCRIPKMSRLEWWSS